MKRLLFAATLAVGLSPAFAATVTVPNGSLSLVYANSAGTTVIQPSASISDSVASAFVTWCETKYIATAGANTVTGCINTWFDDWINQTKASMQTSLQAPAAAAASAAVPLPVITPAQ